MTDGKFTPGLMEIGARVPRLEGAFRSNIMPIFAALPGLREGLRYCRSGFNLHNQVNFSNRIRSIGS